ncbi:MAG: 50S ribosomal protein L17 [Desulfovibrionaceae bacterium]|nr:50S ribosomal protein L17 [Desulfovibrionaceae bacterium]
MRHRKAGRKLNRSDSHRRALFKNMARALLTYERIRTTEAKAKELRRVVDKLITLALGNDLHARRLAYKTLGNHHLVQRLFEDIGPRYSAGGGGYTRIIKLAQPRKGDNAPLVIIELTKAAALKEKSEAKAAKPAAEAGSTESEEAKPAKKPAAKKPAAKKPAAKKAAKSEAEKPAKKPAAKKPAKSEAKKAKEEPPAAAAE